MTAIANLLDGLTVPAELILKQPDGSVRCTACGHRCLVRKGRRGICQVRFNQDGELRVPWGYVAALNADPVEKKPFYHFLPGSIALTFGMLGCDFHCGYCFTGETLVVTSQGPKTLRDLFLGSSHKALVDPNIAYPDDLQVVTINGGLNRVNKVFQHPYHGNLVVIKPHYLPALRCTPDHRLYATIDPSAPPSLMPAQELTKDHYLAIPRQYRFENHRSIDAANELEDYSAIYQNPWKFQPGDMEEVVQASATGRASPQIGISLEKSPAYIRDTRSKVARSMLMHKMTDGFFPESEFLRFPQEHRPGIPQAIALDERIASLLGFYCAKGSVVKANDQPASYSVNFCLSPGEDHIADRIKLLLADVFHAQASLSHQEKTLIVSTSKASIALFFMDLAGSAARSKKIPECIFEASREVTEQFLAAYVSGDGHPNRNGKISVTTVSPDLAYGIAWLALKTGHLASIHETAMPQKTVIQGMEVNRSPIQYTLAWYEDCDVQRKTIETTEFHLVPIKAIACKEFDGYVYNLEVDQNHNFLAGFFLVSNCQNWLTSQALRDPIADESIQFVRRISPEQIVSVARSTGAKVIASSYNEPLITSEWAVAVFKKSREAGMQTVYVSNGNATPEVLEYLHPHLSGMKIDLKSMQDKRYRQLGGVLNNVLDTIQRAKEMGLWLEVVTLVVPGFNDSTDELWEMARFLASVSSDIPWHVTAFHSDYKMQDTDNTPARTLLRAADIGGEAGLHYVYAGNLPGRVDEYENTVCPKCKTTLVKRRGFYIAENYITAKGTCPKCETPVAGVWGTHDPGNQEEGV